LVGRSVGQLVSQSVSVTEERKSLIVAVQTVRTVISLEIKLITVVIHFIKYKTY